MLPMKCLRFGLSIPSPRLVRMNSTASTAAATQMKQGVPLDQGPAAPTPGKDRDLSPRVKDLVEQIVNLSLMEVSDLNGALKKRLNIPDTPFMSPGMAFASTTSAPTPEAAPSIPAESAPQKISFSVKLTKFDDTRKIALIKQIRDLIPGLNLVQAKKFVEGVPVDVKTDLGKNEAEELKTKLEGAGGVAEIV